jgi:hypothetical protein
MLDPLLGFTLQSFLPLAQPYAVSSTFTLVVFKPLKKPSAEAKSPSRSPHFQGFTPRKSLIPNLDGLDQNLVRSSPEYSSLQGLPSSCDSLAFTKLPFVWLNPLD